MDFGTWEYACVVREARNTKLLENSVHDGATDFGPPMPLP